MSAVRLKRKWSEAWWTTGRERSSGYRCDPGGLPGGGALFMRLERSESGPHRCLGKNIPRRANTKYKVSKREMCMVCCRKSRWLALRRVCSLGPAASLPLSTHSDHSHSATTHSIIPPVWSSTPSPFSPTPLSPTVFIQFPMGSFGVDCSPWQAVSPLLI